MPEILARLAPRVGARVVLEPEYRIVGLIKFPNGRKSYFWDNKFNLNSISSVKLAQDKAYTCYFLRLHGYSTPETRTFFNERFGRHIGSRDRLKAACAFAEKLGWPVFIKPCRRSQGEGVTLVSTPNEFIAAAREMLKLERVVLVQQACVGRDYRIVVLDNQVISAYERVPLKIVGDGKSSIYKLIRDRQREFDISGRDTTIPMKDPRIAMCLRHHNRNFKTVPQLGEIVQLLDIANLSLGGTTLDITDTIHPTFCRLAIRIARDLDLRFAGIDLIAPDATKRLGEYHVLEVNSAPGLDHYGSDGPVHQAKIDDLYFQVLRAVERGPL